MGIFDWLILLFIVYLMWRGWRKGFIGTLLHLVGVIMVFFLVAHYFPMVKQGLIIKLHLGTLLSTILAVILIVAMIAIIVQIIKLILERTLKLIHMSFINSAMGALFGFMTGLLLIVVLSILIDVVPALSRPLENNVKHRVYSAVKVVRGEMYTSFKLKSKLSNEADSTIANIPKYKK